MQNRHKHGHVWPIRPAVGPTAGHPHVCTVVACMPEIIGSTSVVIRVTLPFSIIRIMLQFLRVLGRWAIIRVVLSLISS